MKRQEIRIHHWMRRGCRQEKEQGRHWMMIKVRTPETRSHHWLAEDWQLDWLRTDWSKLKVRMPVRMLAGLRNISCTSRPGHRLAHISPAGPSCTGRRGRSTADVGSACRTETVVAGAPGDTGQQGRLLDCTAPWPQSGTSGWARGRTAAGAHLGISPGPPPAPLAGRTGEEWRNISVPPLCVEHSHTPGG